MSNRLNHDSPASIHTFLASEGLAPRKRWGQNFLVNRGAREKILKLLSLESNMNVWEIGPGLGAMSVMLSRLTNNFTVFEIDPAYCDLLRNILEPTVKIVGGDALRTWRKEWRISIPDRVLGNLPYNVASAIIAAFIEGGCLAKRSVFTVQNEMGKRIIAPPCSKDYSSFSILCQANSRILDGGCLSPGSFYPVPRVYSRILVMESAMPYGPIHSPPIFHLLIRRLFSSRRKTLGNNLIAATRMSDFPELSMMKQIFGELGIDLRRRPETIPPALWVAIANMVVSCQ